VLLQLRHVTKRYGDMVVIPDLTLAVSDGEFVGIIGPNGAGKTTLFGLISGSTRCDSGQVLFDGDDVTGLGADARCRAGVGRTFQIPQPFLSMTVYENALVSSTFGAGLRGRDAQLRARLALEQCAIDHIADQIAGTLTLMQRKRLELARAIATQPRLLLLDEVAGGLADAEVNLLLDLIGELHRSGTTIVWIEHLVHALTSVAGRLVVISAGSVLDDGEPNQILKSARVREVYLGSDLDSDVPHAAH